MQSQTNNTPLQEYILISNLPDKSCGLVTSQAVEWLMRNRRTNGLAEYVRKVNGKLYINYRGFCNWFDNQKS